MRRSNNLAGIKLTYLRPISHDKSRQADYSQVWRQHRQAHAPPSRAQVRARSQQQACVSFPLPQPSSLRLAEKVVAEAPDLYHGSQTRHSIVDIQRFLSESRQRAMLEKLCQNQSTTASVQANVKGCYQKL